MKVIFDSNVWQPITLPSNYPSDPNVTDFEAIRQGIILGKIEPFLSETIFTIEAVKRVERQDFLASQKPKVSVDIGETPDGYISMGFSIGPSETDAIDFSGTPILKLYFEEAIKLGFKIVRLPRIGGLVNNEIEPVRYKLEGPVLSSYHKKVFEVARRIEDVGAGMSQIESIGKQYGNRNWMKDLKHAPESDSQKIAKAAAEWADGDSVAIAVALGCDFFCTRDMAKGAGSKSVLSQTNLAWLRADYGFQTILPEDLARLI